MIAATLPIQAQDKDKVDIATNAADRAEIQRDGTRVESSGSTAEKHADWDDAKKTSLEMSAAPQAVKDSLKSNAGNGTLDSQVVRLNKEDQVVYRAVVKNENQEDTHVFVQEDGAVVKMKQKINFKDAPLNVRTAVGKRLGGSDKEPDELYRVIQGQETTYVAKASGNDGKPLMLQVNSMGAVISPAEPIKKTPSGRPGNTGTPDNASQAPADVDADTKAPTPPEGSGRPGNTGTVKEDGQ